MQTCHWEQPTKPKCWDSLLLAWLMMKRHDKDNKIFFFLLSAVKKDSKINDLKYFFSRKHSQSSLGVNSCCHQSSAHGLYLQTTC